MSQNPTREDLVLKKVESYFDGKKPNFTVEGILKEYPKAEIKDTDIYEIEVKEIVDEEEKTVTKKCVSIENVDFSPEPKPKKKK